MTSQNPQIREGVRTVLQGTKKRRVMTQELYGKFSSKADFNKYFSENRKCLHVFVTLLCAVQLYVPPAKMVNKDFIKMVLTEEKALLPLDKVRWVSMPHYDELAVKKFLPMLLADDEFRKYMPEPGKDGRQPERAFFWNIAHTLHRQYVQNLITHANEQRMQAG